MSQQLLANVYQIEGMPQPGAFPMSFPTNSIMMKEAQLAIISQVNSEIDYYPNPKNPIFKQAFMVSESLSSLLTSANDGGTSQVRASIYQINGNPIDNQNICFPASKISIWPHVDGRVNSFIIFNGDKYYAGETRDTLVAAANSGSGGVTIGGTYDNETDAQAALGAGQLYKSSTLINGSPIILITTGSNSEVGGTYDDNATAVAALGTGKLYKSSTLVNGSPIILITI